jgi:drug/metabolite transporter (DMT)-like permease
VKGVTGAQSYLPAGAWLALLAAALFGAGTPLAKLLVGEVPPVLLAGLLYLGSGIGLSVLIFFRRKSAAEATLTGKDVPWLGGAVLFGGVLGPVLLMGGLRYTPGSSASLLLNLEGVFTALLAWFVFHENFDHRIAVGLLLIVGGGAALSWQGTVTGIPWGSVAIVGACLCWGIDNNLTQRVSACDPFHVAAIKGVAAGTINLAIGLGQGGTLPELPILAGALAVGFAGYGLSLALFVLALRHIGTARTGAYFSTAPFVGAALSLVLLKDTIGPLFLVAGLLMAVGVWLHVSERHVHQHTHEQMAHSHPHVHDEHHQHEHEPGIDPTEPHTHWHTHEPITHSHAHFPDIHHRHKHA